MNTLDCNLQNRWLRNNSSTSSIACLVAINTKQLRSMIPNMNNSIRWESVRTIIDDWEEMKIIIAGKWPLMVNVLVWKRTFSAIMFYLFRSCLPYIQICTHRRTSFQWIHLGTFHCSCRVYQSNSSTVSINNEVSSRENGVYKIKVREGRVIYDYCRKRFVSENTDKIK